MLHSIIASTVVSVLVSSSPATPADDYRGSGRYHEPIVPETIEQAGHVECPPGTRYRSSSAEQCQPTATKPVLLAQQYSDNPTWPEGHPTNTERSQGTATR